MFQGQTFYFRFNINFLSGGDVAFVFDVRFNFGSDRNILVRNTMQNGSWGREEREQPYFPFALDQFFELIVLVNQNSYKVSEHCLCSNAIASGCCLFVQFQINAKKADDKIYVC